jgi:hypothetical protein
VVGWWGEEATATLSALDTRGYPSSTLDAEIHLRRIFIFPFLYHGMLCHCWQCSAASPRGCEKAPSSVKELYCEHSSGQVYRSSQGILLKCLEDIFRLCIIDPCILLIMMIDDNFACNEQFSLDFSPWDPT